MSMYVTRINLKYLLYERVFSLKREQANFKKDLSLKTT